MHRGILVLTALLAVSPSVTLSQSDAPPKQAIDISAAEIQAVTNHRPPNRNDQQIRVIDMGKYNMGIGIITRKAVKTGTDVPGVIHHQEAETYIILTGSGTLVTGGKIIDPKPTPPDNIINGPSVLGSVRDGYSRKVGPGDVIIIPPGVFHGWSEIPDQVQYLSVRPDPDRVLKAGYINPSLKK